MIGARPTKALGWVAATTALAMALGACGTQESIPALVTAAAERHPETRIQISEPLGLHEGLIDAVLDRVAKLP